MTRRLPILFIVASGAVLVLRRDLVVRGIRELDRRGGLATNRGERAYARTSRLFAALHDRCVSDAVAAAGAGVTILDVGAGPGEVLAALRDAVPAATIVGVEPSAAMRAIAAKRGLAELEGTAEALPLADGSVDIAVSTLSMHHWMDPAAAFGELRRVLRPGGTARIYDVRFAAYAPAEVTGFAAAAGLDPACIEREVLPERLFGLRPYVRITIHAPRLEETVHAG